MRSYSRYALKTVKRVWHRFTQLACRYRKSSFFRNLDRLAVRYHADYENQDYDIVRNGEKRVLEVLRIIEPKCLLDVGANVGDWTVLANSIHPLAVTHSFEIAEPTFKQLENRVKGMKNVCVHNFGLGDRNGTIELNFAPDEPTVTSAVSLSFTYGQTITRTERLPCRIMRGDDFLTENAIFDVDYLKLDVEGMEDRVIEGLRSHLSKGKITAIQFEYGMVNIATHFLLADFYLLFSDLGYSVGKIYPTYVDFTRYDYTKENFIGGNYIAVQNGKADLIAALQ